MSRTEANSRAHRILYVVLAASWYASLAVMFVGLPLVAAFAIPSGSHPVALWSVVTLVLLGLSLRARLRAETPGRIVGREEAPQLHALVDRVRRVAGIGPVGEIRLLGMPNVGVTRVFRGGILYGRPVKVLLLGIPYLRALTVPELESILVHEFGHFLGQDVRRGERLEEIGVRLRDLRRALDRTGPVKWCNPVYLWVRVFGAVYGPVTAGIRRRQELLADDLAALTCGADVFGRGLLKSAATARIFTRVAGRVVGTALENGGLPDNVFLDFRLAVRALRPADRRRALREAREAAAAPSSSHPPLATRLERIDRLWVRRRRRPEPRAARLVPSLEEVERELTPDTVRLLAATLVVRARRRAESVERRPQAPVLALRTPALLPPRPADFVPAPAAAG